jgi:hypothetical protein
VQDLKVMHRRRAIDQTRELLCRIQAQNGELKVIIGYARVSTDGQTLDAQRAALAAAGAERVYAEAGSAGAQHQGPPERA